MNAKSYYKKTTVVIHLYAAGSPYGALAAGQRPSDIFSRDQYSLNSILACVLLSKYKSHNDF